MEHAMKGNPVFGSFGRFQETPKAEMPPDMKAAFDFTMRLRGEVPGPHKIWICNPKLSETIVPTGAYYQTKSTLSKAEIEIVTNVINGRWLAAYSNYEHEMIGENLGHLPPEKVLASSGAAKRRRRKPCRRSVVDRDVAPTAARQDRQDRRRGPASRLTGV
jgi:4-carboxymuconolactone decarboxylase